MRMQIPHGSDTYSVEQCLFSAAGSRRGRKFPEAAWSHRQVNIEEAVSKIPDPKSDSSRESKVLDVMDVMDSGAAGLVLRGAGGKTISKKLLRSFASNPW